MIEIRNISKIYTSKSGDKIKALDDVSLKFGNKGLVFLVGRSGSGKSTLLNILGGLDSADEGELIVADKNISFADNTLDGYRNFAVGFVFQEYNLVDALSVKENVAIALELQKSEYEDSRIENVLNDVGLENLSNRYPEELSGGQKQRVAIARALIKNPEIILADEPTGNLDYTTGKEILELLHGLSKEKLVVVVTHDMDFAKEYGDIIIEIKDGKIVSNTTPNEIEIEKESSFEIKKSKLPNKYSLRLAFNSFKRKKVRLTLSIMIGVFALSMFGLTLTLTMFDTEQQLSENIIATSNNLVSARMIDGFNDMKEGNFEHNYFDQRQGNIKSSTLDNLKNRYPQVQFWETIEYSPIYLGYGYNNNTFKSTKNESVIIKNKKDIENMGLSMMPGYKELSEDSAYITDAFIYQMINNSPYIDYYVFEKDKFVVLDNEYGLENIVGKTIYRDWSYPEEYMKMCEVAGIVKTGYIEFKENYNNLSENEKVLFDCLSKEIYFLSFINEDFYNQMMSQENNFSFNIGVNGATPNYYENSDMFIKDSNNQTKSLDNFGASEANIGNTYQYVSGNNTDDNLRDNDVYLSLQMYNKIFGTNHVQSDFLKRTQNGFLYELISHPEHIGKTFDLQIYDKSGNLLINFVDLRVKDIIVENYYYVPQTIAFQSDKLDEIRQSVNNSKGLILSTNLDKADLSAMMKDLREDELFMLSPYSYDIYRYETQINTFRTIFLIISLVLLAVSVLFMMNFIMASAADKKREIGILRALGASKNDVLKTFAFEGLFISSVMSIFATIIVVAGTFLMDFILVSSIASGAILLSINIYALLAVIALSFVVVAISASLPVYRITKLKPVDAIKKVV